VRRRNKYGNKITVIDGIKFHSQKEGRRYQQLKLLEQAGVIHNLIRQPAFILTAHGVKICKYTGDFYYIEDGKLVIEDVKGKPTRDFKLRWKLLQAQEGNKYVYRLT